MTFGRFIIINMACILLGGCYGYPEQVSPVQNFDAAKYMGTWYEIARLDHSFERGLNNVSATYRLENGQVNIVNKGYSEQQKKWELATGKALFAEDKDIGYFHVSFFGPFSSTYLIFELGKNYEYAFVCGPNTDYLWLLLRNASGNEELIKNFRQETEKKGFNPEELIIVHHN